MEKLLHVSSSPHVRSKAKTSTIMLLVIIALWPAACFGVWLNGPYAAAVLGVSIGAAVLTEYIYERLMKRPVTVGDGSAVVTGLLLGMNLPPLVPLWMPALGSVFAILVVKQFFGGLGQNFMNPALAGRCFLMISFSARMTSFAVSDGTLNKIVDTVSGATPLAEIKGGGSFDLLSMFLGTTRGTIGETCTLALLAGGIFLVITGVIRLTVPLAYLGSFSVFALLAGGHGMDFSWLAARYPAYNTYRTDRLWYHTGYYDRAVPLLRRFGRGRVLRDYFFQSAGAADRTADPAGRLRHKAEGRRG